MTRSTRPGFCHAAARLLLALTLLGAMTAASANILVTDLDGEVTRGGKTVDLLTPLLPGERLRLIAGARVVVAFVAHAREFAASGPGEFRVEASSLSALPGSAKPQMRELPAVYRQVKLDTTRLGQAGVRLRADSARLELVPRGLVAEAPRFFHWPAGPATEGYVFRLADAKRNLIYEARLLDPALSLPDSIRMKPGAVYYWGVEMPGSGREASWTRLHVAANALLAKQLEAARPEPQAPRSERILYSLAAETPLPN